VATPQASQQTDAQILESFTKDFKHQWEPAYLTDRYDPATQKSVKVVYTRSGPEALDSRLPFYGILSRQADRAATHVKSVEDYLNRQGVFCIPVREPCSRTDDGNKYTPESASERALAIARVGDKWRIVVERWTVFPWVRGRWTHSKVRRKPWLECSLVDKVATIHALPGVLDKLVGEVRLLKYMAEKNSPALERLEQSVSIVAALK
jgi:hypothetical protein